MKPDIVVTWSQAEQMANESRQYQLEQAEIKLEEFMTSDISMMDAVDIFYYAEITKLEPNQLRRIHPESDFQDYLHTFENDDSDDILTFF